MTIRLDTMQMMSCIKNTIRKNRYFSVFLDVKSAVMLMLFSVSILALNGALLSFSVMSSLLEEPFFQKGKNYDSLDHKLFKIHELRKFRNNCD